MNREIKFRAWHKNLKKMFKIGQITLEKGTWNYEPNDRDFIYRNEYTVSTKFYTNAIHRTTR